MQEDVFNAIIWERIIEFNSIILAFFSMSLTPTRMMEYIDFFHQKNNHTQIYKILPTIFWKLSVVFFIPATNYHKFSGLQPHKFIILLSWAQAMSMAMFLSIFPLCGRIHFFAQSGTAGIQFHEIVGLASLVAGCYLGNTPIPYNPLSGPCRRFLSFPNQQEASRSIACSHLSGLPFSSTFKSSCDWVNPFE